MQQYTGAPILDYRAQPKYLQLSPAAQYCGLSVDTLRDRIRSGQLPAYRTGKGRNMPIVVKIADLDAMLEPIPTVGNVATAVAR